MSGQSGKTILRKRSRSSFNETVKITVLDTLGKEPAGIFFAHWHVLSEYSVYFETLSRHTQKEETLSSYKEHDSEITISCMDGVPAFQLFLTLLYEQRLPSTSHCTLRSLLVWYALADQYCFVKPLESRLLHSGFMSTCRSHPQHSLVAELRRSIQLILERPCTPSVWIDHLRVMNQAIVSHPHLYRLFFTDIMNEMPIPITKMHQLNANVIKQKLHSLSDNVEEQLNLYAEFFGSLSKCTFYNDLMNMTIKQPEIKDKDTTLNGNDKKSPETKLPPPGLKKRRVRATLQPDKTWKIQQVWPPDSLSNRQFVALNVSKPAIAAFCQYDVTHIPIATMLETALHKVRTENNVQKALTTTTTTTTTTSNPISPPTPATPEDTYSALVEYYSDSKTPPSISSTLITKYPIAIHFLLLQRWFHHDAKHAAFGEGKCWDAFAQQCEQQTETQFKQFLQGAYKKYASPSSDFQSEFRHQIAKRFTRIKHFVEFVVSIIEAPLGSFDDKKNEDDLPACTLVNTLTTTERDQYFETIVKSFPTKDSNYRLLKRWKQIKNLLTWLNPSSTQWVSCLRLFHNNPNAWKSVLFSEQELIQKLVNASSSFSQMQLNTNTDIDIKTNSDTSSPQKKRSPILQKKTGDLIAVIVNWETRRSPGYLEWGWAIGILVSDPDPTPTGFCATVQIVGLKDLVFVSQDWAWREFNIDEDLCIPSCQKNFYVPTLESSKLVHMMYNDTTTNVMLKPEGPRDILAFLQ